MDLSDVERFAKETDFATRRNKGGMGPPDMASTYTLLKRLNPAVVIESGVHKGVGTKLIRKALGKKALVYCLDPRDVPKVDANPLTIYLTGERFVDLADLDLSGLNMDKVLFLLDDHCNQEERLNVCASHGAIHMLFNDNYPRGEKGSHKSLDNIAEDKDILERIDVKTIFPPVYPTDFHTVQSPLITKGIPEYLQPFHEMRNSYRHNTYVRFRSTTK